MGRPGAVQYDLGLRGKAGEGYIRAGSPYVLVYMNYYEGYKNSTARRNKYYKSCLVELYKAIYIYILIFLIHTNTYLIIYYL